MTLCSYGRYIELAILTVTVFLASLNVSYGVQFTDDMAAKLEKLLEDSMNDFSCLRAPALTVGVATTSAENNEFHTTLGLRDVENNIAADENTLFGIGSTSKAMTSIVANKVLSDHGYSWEQPIVEYYPDLKMPREEMTAQVTFKDLFSHSTCISRDDFWWTSGPDQFNIDSLMENLSLMNEECEFRKGFVYNNLMYVVGSHIIEQIANATWGDLIKETIFDPLGMDNSVSSFDVAQKTGNWLKGYVSYDGEFVPLQEDCDAIIDLVGQAGSIHSTASDMIKYMRHIIQNNASEYADLFWQPVIDTKMDLSPADASLIEPPFPTSAVYQNYTVSWLLGEYDGGEVLMHGGDTFTTHTLISLSREHEYGVFVSATGDSNARSRNMLISWYVQDLLTGKEPWINASTLCSFPEPWKEAKNQTNEDTEWEKYQEAYSEELLTYARTYSSDVFGNVTIGFRDGEGLTFTYNRMNCTLRQHETEKKMFRCHANAPFIASDSRVSITERILTVEFVDGYLLTNMMESNSSVRFNSALRTSTSSVLLLFLLGLTRILQ